MGELEGVWTVERTGGALPPLVGVIKEIEGARGWTRVGPVPAAPFDVDGLVLRYRAPFAAFADVLEPHGDGFRGRATFMGREYGRFVMRRKERSVATSELEQQLVKYIDEAYAMEQSVLRMLDSMITTTDDPDMKKQLELHRKETEQQAERLEQRLRAHGASPSVIKEAGGVVGALMKGVLDIARGAKPGRNARDGYATEHMEIASYELLERVAERAGDEETAQVARANRAEEQAMADAIAATWDKVVDLSLEKEGVAV